MSPVAIVTDSTNCLPAAVIRDYAIKVAPASLSINGRNYLDEVDMTAEQLCGLLPGLKKLPTTSGVGPGQFVKCFEDVAKVASDILCIVMSRAVSVTCESAETSRRIVQKDNPGLRIEVLDSRAGNGALGFIVLEAARAASQGKSLDEVKRAAENMLPRVKHFLALHTRDYLDRLGRTTSMCDGTDAACSDLKTVITVNRESGKVELVGKYDGESEAMEAMIAGAKEHLGSARDAHFMVHYSHDVREAESLKKQVVRSFGCAEPWVTRFSAVSVCSTGPKFGMSFYS